MILGLLACALPPGPGTGVDTSEPTVPTPAIGSFSVDCDADADRWTVTLEATAWGGNAPSFWTVDGAYVEVHRVSSVAYEEDGSGESYALSLGIVSDWRAQADGVNTAFTCAQPVDVLLTLQDLDGVVVDCRSWGPSPERWVGLPGIPPCDAR